MPDNISALEEQFAAIAEEAIAKVNALNCSAEQRVVGLRIIHESIECVLMDAECGLEDAQAGAED